VMPERYLHSLFIHSKRRGFVLVPAGLLCDEDSMDNQERFARWEMKVELREPAMPVIKFGDFCDSYAENR